MTWVGGSGTTEYTEYTEEGMSGIWKRGEPRMGRMIRMKKEGQMGERRKKDLAENIPAFGFDFESGEGARGGGGDGDAEGEGGAEFLG
jgi:hypothetical protein